MTLGDLETFLDGHAILINSQDEGFALFDGQDWSGTLTEIVAGQMYRILTNAETGFTMTGTAVTSTITLLPGYNWFGYTGSQSRTISSAFSGFTPIDGDTITDQNGDVAEFNGDTQTWEGTLLILVPGHGYVYYSNAVQGRSVTFE